MSPDRKADVIVAADHDGAPVLRCLDAVLERSGPILNRLIVVNDQGPGSEIARELERFAGRDRRVLIVSNTHPLGPVGSCNRGLDQRHGDAVLLAADGIVADDWLDELAAVAHSEERTACASPLTNIDGPCSVTAWDRCHDSDSLDENDVRAASPGCRAGRSRGAIRLLHLPARRCDRRRGVARREPGRPVRRRR